MLNTIKKHQLKVITLDDEFLNDHCTYRELVIKEMYKRLVETGIYTIHIR